MITRTTMLGACLVLASAVSASAETFVTFDVPGGHDTQALNWDKNGDIIGIYVNQEGAGRGFIRLKDASFAFFQGDGQASSISRGGATAGTFSDESGSHAFIGGLDGSETTPFDVPGLRASLPQSIDSRGAVAGFGVTDTNSYRGFIRKPNGKAKKFDAPGAGAAANRGTQVSGMTETGTIYGGVMGDNGIRHGFLRDPAGNFTVFDPPGSVRTSVTFVAKDGTAMGPYRDESNVWHGYVRAPDGSFAIFDAPGAGTGEFQGTQLFTVNKNGVMHGTMIDSNTVSHGFLRSAKGKFTFYDAPGAGTAAFTGTQGGALNDKNEVLGNYEDNDLKLHSYIRRP